MRAFELAAEFTVFTPGAARHSLPVASVDLIRVELGRDLPNGRSAIRSGLVRQDLGAGGVLALRVAEDRLELRDGLVVSSMPA